MIRTTLVLIAATLSISDVAHAAPKLKLGNSQLPSPVTSTINRGVRVSPRPTPMPSIQVSPEAAPSPGPGGVTVADYHGNVLVSWNSVTGADGYNVYRATGESKVFTKLSGDTPVTSTSFVDSKVVGGIKYRYLVRSAVKASNGIDYVESGDSAVLSIVAKGTVSSDYLIQPTVSNSDSGSSWGSGIEYDYGTKTGVGSYSVIGTYSHVKPTGANSFSDYSAELDTTLTSATSPLNFTAVLNYDKAITQAHALTYGGSLTYTGKLGSLSGSLSYVKSSPDGGGETSGIRPSITAVVPATSALKLIGVYVPNNKIDQQSGYQLGVNANLNSSGSTSVRVLVGNGNSVSGMLTLAY